MSDEKKNGKNFISNHILPTSSNLLGLCFVILSFMKVTKLGLETMIDELVAVAIVLFLSASVLSYVSVRTTSKKSDHYEKTADIIFLSGLGLLTVIAVIVIFEFI
jgi:hypothetical protein